MSAGLADDEIILANPLNMNRRVIVRLTEYGQAVLNNYFFTRNKSAITPDNQGYYYMHMWELIKYFGEHVQQGGNQCFVNNEIRLVGFRSEQKIRELEIEIIKCKTRLKFFEHESMKDIILFYGDRKITEAQIHTQIKSLEDHIRMIESGEWED